MKGPSSGNKCEMWILFKGTWIVFESQKSENTGETCDIYYIKHCPGGLEKTPPAARYFQK